MAALPATPAGSPACLDRFQPVRSESSVSLAPTHSACLPSDAVPSPQTSECKTYENILFMAARIKIIAKFKLTRNFFSKLVTDNHDQ